LILTRKLGHREIGVLQRDGTERDEPLRPGRDDFCKAIVHRPREL